MSDENGTQVADCCCDPDDLEEHPDSSDDLTIRVCSECGRRHFEAVAEPLHMRIETT